MNGGWTQAGHTSFRQLPPRLRQTQNGPGTSPFRARQIDPFLDRRYRTEKSAAAAATRSLSGFIERCIEAVKLSDQRPSSAM